MRNRVDSLNAWEREALIEWLMNKLEPGNRAELMRDLPVVYNKICGRPIVEVRLRDRCGWNSLLEPKPWGHKGDGEEEESG